MTQGEALIHGDLHTGSVMVGQGRVIIIDPEFAFYGPLGFDLGVFWGNCIIAAVRAHLAAVPEDAIARVDEFIAASWESFIVEWSQLWPQRTDAFFSDEYVDSYLRKVWSDGLGFAGTEAMRRVIGYAHASDVTSLPVQEQLRAAQAIVRISRNLIVNRGEIAEPHDLAELIRNEIRATRAAETTGGR